MTKSEEVAPDVESIMPSVVPMEVAMVGTQVWYWPAEYHARHVSGPWAATVLKVASDDSYTLAVMPPMPVPVGTDPVARVTEVKFSPDRKPGTWGWPGR